MKLRPPAGSWFALSLVGLVLGCIAGLLLGRAVRRRMNAGQTAGTPSRAASIAPTASRPPSAPHYSLKLGSTFRYDVEGETRRPGETQPIWRFRGSVTWSVRERSAEAETRLEGDFTGVEVQTSGETSGPPNWSRLNVWLKDDGQVSQINPAEGSTPDPLTLVLFWPFPVMLPSVANYDGVGAETEMPVVRAGEWRVCRRTRVRSVEHEPGSHHLQVVAETADRFSGRAWVGSLIPITVKAEATDRVWLDMQRGRTLKVEGTVQTRVEHGGRNEVHDAQELSIRRTISDCSN